jgi:hypothetical protein
LWGSDGKMIEIDELADRVQLIGRIQEYIKYTDCEMSNVFKRKIGWK